MSIIRDIEDIVDKKISEIERPEIVFPDIQRVEVINPPQEKEPPIINVAPPEVRVPPPIVNVEAPIVNVEKPDLSELAQGLKDLSDKFSAFAEREYPSFDYKEFERIARENKSSGGGVISFPIAKALKEQGRVSTFNSTSETLGASASYTGTWEDITSFASISVIASATANATLYADFSTDGATTARAVQLSSGTDTTLGIHSLIPISKYFRVRVVDAGAGSNAIVVQTIYHIQPRIAQPTSRLGQALTTYSDVLNTRAILANINGTNVNVTDHNALQVTPPAEGKTAFGEALSAQLTHEVLASFVYNINPLVVTSEENQSGTVTQANAMAVASTGAAASSSGTLYTKQRIRYQPGHGSRARFTALFTSGVANSTQLAGIGDAGNGFFFGYNGTSFGILHRKNGSREVRVLTITTKSSTAENVTVTLDGVAKSVAVTNGADATVTANEIAAGDYTDTGRGWTAKAHGNKVTFISWNAAAHTSTYSVAGTTIAGSFAQAVVGVAPSEEWTAQSSWNGADKFNGSGLTGVTLDPTRGNVYQISFQWLGFGAINFYIEDPDDGEFHLVHTIEFANANTTPSLSNPTLPIRISAENTSNTSNVVVKCASMGAFTDGRSELIGPRFATDASVTLGATSAETPFFTIRNKTTYQSKLNTTSVKLLKIFGAVEHTKPVQIVVYKNATLVAASFSDYSTNTSSIETDTSATSFTGGTEQLAISLGKTGNGIVDFANDRFGGILDPGDSYTFTIKPKSGNAAEATVSVRMVELF